MKHSVLTESELTALYLQATRETPFMAAAEAFNQKFDELVAQAVAAKGGKK